MTEPVPSLAGAENTTISVEEITREARRLGLTWGLRSGKLTTADTVTYDGEDAPAPVKSLVGKLTVGQRVMVMFVPPSGNYIIGILGDQWDLAADITIQPEPSSTGIAITFNHDYEIYVDNTGAGADNTRLWLDCPDNGQVVIGPRAGADLLDDFRVRTGSTTASAANMFINASTYLVSRSTSSAQYKTNIRDADIDLAKLLKLRAVSFHDKNEFATEGDSAKRHIGFIAEEVHDAGLCELIHYRDSEPDGVQYDRFVPLLLQMISELTNRIERLEQQLSKREP